MKGGQWKYRSNHTCRGGPVRRVEPVDIPVAWARADSGKTPQVCFPKQQRCMLWLRHAAEATLRQSGGGSQRISDLLCFLKGADKELLP